MASIEQNLQIWNVEHEWPLEGDEWSEEWGGARAQWFGSLLPRISWFLPAAHVLEIAPGYGRWTQFLAAHTKQLSVVDISPRCIAACQARFSGLTHLRYHVNDGRSLDMIEDDSIDFVFSFDSLVHADADTMHAYAQQMARKLRLGGTGFIHHSNLGAHKSWLVAKRNVVRLCRGRSRLGNLLIHDCLRAPEMTASLMADFCTEAGLTCAAQEIIPWGQSHRAIDCLTVFKKEAVRTQASPRILVNHRFLQEAADVKRLAWVYNGSAATLSAEERPGTP
jgi:SAM-dependent methyltransferase